MRAMGAWIVLALLLVGCAGWTGPSAVGTGSQQSAWQERLDQARRDAAAGRATSLMMGPVGVYTFYNNPRPFCYMYIIPGEWVPAPQPANTYRSKDGRAYVTVEFVLARNLEGLPGSNLVERTRTASIRNVEKIFRIVLTGDELIPFDSARPGAWKWKAAPFKQGELYIHLQGIIVDLSPDAVVQITIGGTPDDDDLARRIIASLRTTSDPKCYWPVLEGMWKAMLRER